MTEKRFIIFQDSYDDLYIQDKEVYRATGIKVGNEEDIKYEDVLKIVEILNELHEEVQAQSIVIKGYQERNDKLFKENEQLKKQLNAFKPIIFEDANNGSSSVLYEKVEE